MFADESEGLLIGRLECFQDRFVAGLAGERMRVALQRTLDRCGTEMPPAVLGEIKGDQHAPKVELKDDLIVRARRALLE